MSLSSSHCDLSLRAYIGLATSSYCTVSLYVVFHLLLLATDYNYIIINLFLNDNLPLSTFFALNIHLFLPAFTKWQFVNPLKPTYLGIENQLWHEIRRLEAIALFILKGGDKIPEPQPPKFPCQMPAYNQSRKYCRYNWQLAVT